MILSKYTRMRWVRRIYVLLHDDLLATGGTALAAIELLENFNVRQIYVCFIIELDFLQGRQRLSSYSDVYSLIHF